MVSLVGQFVLNFTTLATKIIVVNSWCKYDINVYNMVLNCPFCIFKRVKQRVPTLNVFEII